MEPFINICACVIAAGVAIATLGVAAWVVITVIDYGLYIKEKHEDE
jgi:hypothetical protein